MSEEEIEEFLLISSDLDVFVPKNSEKAMKNLIQDLKTQRQRIDELETKMNSLLAYEKERESSVQEQIRRIEEKMVSDAREEANKRKKLEEQIASNEKENQRKIANYTRENDNKIQKLEEQIEKSGNKIHQIESYSKEETNKLRKIEEHINEILSQKEDNENEVKSIQTQIIEIEKKCQQASNEAIEKQKALITENQQSIIQIKELMAKNSKLTKKSNGEASKDIKSFEDVISSFQKFKILLRFLHPAENFPNGIFQGLFSRFKFNPAEKGLIKIDGNSHNGYENVLRKIIDPTSDSVWISANAQNSYISIEFTCFLVALSEYKIKVGDNDGDFFFNSWIVEGVTSDNKVIVLSEVNNSPKINRSKSEAKVSISNKSFLRSIKITMKGKNSFGANLMNFRNIEIYGTVQIGL